MSLRTAALDLVVRHPELAGPGAAEASRKVSATLRAAVATVTEEGVYSAVTAHDGVDRVTAYRRLAKHPMYEPPRVLRRLQLLRRWSHEEVKQVLT